MDATPDKAYDAARYRRSGRGKIFDSVLDLIGGPSTALWRASGLLSQPKTAA